MNDSVREIRPHRNERVLVIDDDPGVSHCVECVLQIAGCRAHCVSTAKAGLDRVANEEFDLIITDLRLPDLSGLEVIRAVKEVNPDVPIILMTSYSSIESAIEALRNGATDYIIKPFRNDDFSFAVQRALNERRMRRENVVLKRNLKKAFSGGKIIGESAGIKRVLSLIERVAPSDANVLIQGESGTGKELVALAIHYASHRADAPFVPINCGAIPGELLESELFGHVKGAYTGAHSTREGLIREADGGTLFLDEISELPLDLQVKLLRVLQEREVRPVGSNHTYQFDVRFLAACNRSLKSLMEEGKFRADLYYRLNVISIEVPPLRQRGKDVELLAQHFVDYHSRRLGKRIRGISEELRRFLYEYPWPGNVRELENVIERAVILSDSEMLGIPDFTDVSAMVQGGSPASQLSARSGTGSSFREDVLSGPMTIEEYIREFVKRYQDNYTDTELAAMLGIGRKSLWTRRRRWGLTRERSRRGSGHERLPPVS